MLAVGHFRELQVQGSLLSLGNNKLFSMAGQQRVLFEIKCAILSVISPCFSKKTSTFLKTATKPCCNELWKSARTESYRFILQAQR